MALCVRGNSSETEIAKLYQPADSLLQAAEQHRTFKYRAYSSDGSDGSDCCEDMSDAQSDLTTYGSLRTQISGQQREDPLEEAFYLFSEQDWDYFWSCLCKEVQVQADASYLSTKQQEVDAHKRLMLVDWLVEVVDEFELGQETLFLAVTLLDRFMSLKTVLCCQLQLLGITSLWVAAKYEEVMPPALQSFVDITDNSYAPEDLIQMEAILLTTLGFELAVPTSLHFLHQLLSHAQLETGSSSPRGPCHPACPTEAVLVHLAEYLLELALLSPDTLRFRPSVVAAAALQLSADMLASRCDPSSRAAYSNLCQAISTAAGEQLEDCMQELHHMHAWAGSTAQPPCVREKYSDIEHSYVGLLSPQQLA